MRIYKYRDLSDVVGPAFHHLTTILQRETFWCARPDTLNDPAEFAWTCRYDPTKETEELLTNTIVKVKGRTPDDARARARRAIDGVRVEPLASPIIGEMIRQCRDEMGLVCFGTSAVNPVLWQRYGGNGAGVCIELDVAEDLLGQQLHYVQYSSDKVIHIDYLLHAFLDDARVKEFYSLALLSKPLAWSTEREVRFISNRQSVSVQFDRSRIVGLWLGSRLSADNQRRVAAVVDDLPYRLQLQRVIGW